jgi:hypothetical protein
VTSHQDLPRDRDGVAVVAVTMSDRVHWPARRRCAPCRICIPIISSIFGNLRAQINRSVQQFALRRLPRTPEAAWIDGGVSSRTRRAGARKPGWPRPGTRLRHEPGGRGCAHRLRREPRVAALSAGASLKLPRCLECIFDGTSVAPGEISDDHHVVNVPGRHAEGFGEVPQDRGAVVEVGSDHHMGVGQ